MAAPTNTFQTYQAKGNREDLANVIYKISPTETPFLSAIDKVDAEATYHEWQTQDLAAAAANAQIEGDDATAIAATPTVRLGNYTQIMSKAVIVSGTQDEVKKAGRGSELAMQLSLKGQELKRDMEFGMCQNGTHNAGAAGTARQLRGLEGWSITNASYGAGGAAPSFGSNTGPTDGTQRAFTEAMLKTVLQSIWVEGGKPDMLMMGGAQKQTFSGFNGANNTREIMAADKKVVATIEVYVSDFGTVKAVPNRFQRPRTVFAIQSDMWAVAALRPMKTTPLAKTGDAEKRLLITEFTLEARQEKSGGVVRDLT